MTPTPLHLAKLRLPDSGVKLRQLRNFLAVLEAGSLRRAGERWVSPNLP
jgi:hypothetical protein